MMNEVTLYFKIDSEKKSVPNKLCVSFNSSKKIDYEGMAKLVTKSDKEKLLKMLCLDDEGVRPEDVHVITKEEYDADDEKES